MKTTSAAGEMYKSKLNIECNATSDMNDAGPPLKNLMLRGNQLCGSILIGNYSYLTQLEVCENEMEVLDLSSLAQLETLKCNRNKLMELMINGRNLTSIFAAYNCLHSITITPVPSKLIHLDISHNSFTTLPSWVGACTELQTLNANSNQLQSVIDLLTTYRINGLRILNIAYNHIRVLSRLPEKSQSIEQLYLQSNELQQLPPNFFDIVHKRVRVINASCNRLTALPDPETEVTAGVWPLKELFLSNNHLDETMFEILLHATQLRTLHAAYNKIGVLPEACVRSWTEMEELVLSGNMLQQLPVNISVLTRLQVLRVHSNLLLTTPPLSKLCQLRVLDLAHNHLDRINLLSMVPKSLKCLDLSCNLQLQVDANQLKVCQSQRNWSLVDVSGKNRPCLPTTKLDELKDSNILRPPWQLGFSETPGKCRKLLVSQLRQCNYRTDEALFGIFESDAAIGNSAKTLAKLAPKILQQERIVKDNSTGGEYMKYTLLSVQQQLLESQQQQLVGISLCHISRENQCTKKYVKPQKTKKYVLRVASAGNVGAYLVRKTANVCLTQERLTRVVEPVGNGKLLLLPDPHIVEVVLSNDDEYLVICNGQIWAVMDIDRVAREIRKEENVLLAAKRVQDIAQSYGAEGNLSAIVVRFRNVGTDVDCLIKELKQLVRKKPMTACSKCTCCDRNNACRHRGINERLSGLLPGRLLSAGTTRSDRSSPSGQSDQAPHCTLNKQDADAEDDGEHALNVCGDETDSVLSEEQFKCWEYMLEQNTQLLFDKELNTISKSFTKNYNMPDRLDYKSNLLKNVNSKFISTSSPHLLNHSEEQQPLANSAAYQQQQLSFLSRYFGSSRSFQTSAAATVAGCNFFDARNRDSLAAASYAKLGGGPNAAYFGSLQRLMPYNLEYDFAVTQERSALDEDDDEYHTEHVHRMRKYWGVATTEL